MKKTTDFHVPTLAEADAEYGAMQAKLAELADAYAKTKRELNELEADMRARPAPAIRPGVAELLGEAVDPTLAGRSGRLAELRKHLGNVEAAQAIITRNLADRRGIASAAACKAVKAEYSNRVAGIVSALQAVDAARLLAEEILDELERNDVQIGYLPALRPTWLGDLKEGCVAQYIREAKEAGYV